MEGFAIITSLPIWNGWQSSDSNYLGLDMALMWPPLNTAWNITKPDARLMERYFVITSTPLMRINVNVHNRTCDGGHVNYWCVVLSRCMFLIFEQLLPPVLKHFLLFLPLAFPFRNQRFLPLRRCGPSWAAGQAHHWWNLLKMGFSGWCSLITLSSWSRPQSITSPGGTVTWQKWGGSLTAKATASAHHSVTTELPIITILYWIILKDGAS